MDFNIHNELVTRSDISPGTTTIVSIDHIDIDPNGGYGRITFYYEDGTDVYIQFYGNGGLDLSHNDHSAKLNKGSWNLESILQLPKFMTAFCSKTYIKNTWEFCVTNVMSIDFVTNTTWSGMNSVKIISSSTIPIYLRCTPIISLQESEEKIILSTLDTKDAIYAKRRIENYHQNRMHDFPKVTVDFFVYPETNLKVFKCTCPCFSNLMKIVCASDDFFVDCHDYVCCKSWDDVTLLNNFLGTKFVVKE